MQHQSQTEQLSSWLTLGVGCVEAADAAKPLPIAGSP